MFISVEEIKVMENSRIRMWCDVPFALPTDIEVIWRFAEEVRSAYGESFRVTVKSNSSSFLQNTHTSLLELALDEMSNVISNLWNLRLELEDS